MGIPLIVVSLRIILRKHSWTRRYRRGATQHPWRTPFRTGKGAPMWPLTLSDDDMSVNSIPMRERLWRLGSGSVEGIKRLLTLFVGRAIVLGHMLWRCQASQKCRLCCRRSSESQKLASSVRASEDVLINAAARDKAQLGFADKVPYERG